MDSDSAAVAAAAEASERQPPPDAPEPSLAEQDEQQDNTASPPTASSAESEFTAVGMQSNSEEWQVVDIPPQEPKQEATAATSNTASTSNTTSTSSSKAQKWKDRLAKKSGQKSVGADTATPATTTTKIEGNKEEEEEVGAVEDLVEDSLPMTTEDPNNNAQAAADEETGDQADAEIVPTTDSTGSDVVAVSTEMAPTENETQDSPIETTTATDTTTSDETPANPATDPEPIQEQEQDADTTSTHVPSTVETQPEGDDITNTPVEVSEETQRNQPMSLQASYQEIAEAKRKREEAARLEAEKRAEDERVAKEAERLESIARLEEERKQLRLEEQRKAREELQQQQQQQQQQQKPPQISSDSATPLPTSPPPQPTLSTTATTSSKSMVVLVSKSFGTVAQRTSQDRAITSLKGQRIPFDEVDGSDPTLKDIRNDLFAISGLRGSYPQFFIKDGDQITFLGDSDTFEYMNESGTLSQYFPLVTTESNKSTPPETVPATVVPPVTATATAESLETPVAANASGKTILVLVSKSFGTMTQRTNQERALTTLYAKGIPCEEVDGSDPALKDKRNQLFEISGLRGQYPQFFVKDGDTITFLGDFETFETLNETGQLVATTTVTTAPDEQPSTPRAMEEPARTTDDPPSSNKLMIVLVSKSFGTLAQKTNQERAITMLKGNKIPFDEVDGSNPAFHDLRNSLFAISGIRGNYPQFFVKESDQITFLGDFEAFEALNDTGTLASSFVATETPPEPESQPSASTTESNSMIPSKKMIALVSKSFATVALTTNQERAFTILRNRNIPFEQVDGSDPQNKDQRNNFFDISGIRGKYPQFFIQHDQEITFLGDLDVLEGMNDMGTLSISLLMSTSTESRPTTTAEDRSVTFSASPNQVWTSRDSTVVPPESFENEFTVNDDDDGNDATKENNEDDVTSRSTSMTTSVDSLQFDGTEEPPPTSTILRSKVARANSEDSDMIPNESFENEFDSPIASLSKKRFGRKSPDEIFENEFDPIDEEDTTKDTVPITRNDDDEKHNDDDDKDSPSLLLTMYLPIAIGVAVIVGMWLSGQRGGPHSLHIQ